MKADEMETAAAGMCVHVRVCACICVYFYVCAYVCVAVCVCFCATFTLFGIKCTHPRKVKQSNGLPQPIARHIRIFIYVNAYTYIYIYMCAYTCESVHVCACVCIIYGKSLALKAQP